ncbi:MAG: polysaccharide biosynthesis tyrosine autokinase [Tannerella sp.]|jgi:capsular exopolysaccharide synthesis family protein|nr:polysaccharide biosynthesis tyrosine autokinase [Tannerella sp.]
MEITQQKKSDEKDGMSIADILAKYFRHWIWFVISATVCLGLGILFLLSRDIQYQVSMHTMLNEEKSSSAATDAQMEALGIHATVNNLENEIVILHSPDLMMQVVEALNLETGYYVKNLFGRKTILYAEAPYRIEFTPGDESEFKEMELTVRWNNSTYVLDGQFTSTTKIITLKEELRELPATIPLPDDAGTLSVHATGKPFLPVCHVDIQKAKHVASSLARALSINPTSDVSSVLKIDLRTGNPELGAAVLEELVRQYNGSASLETKQRALGMSAFINERLGEISVELGIVEDDVVEYKQKNKITDLASETELYMQQTGEYERQRIDAETQLRIVGMVERFVKDNPYGEPIPSLGVNDPELSQAISEYNANVAAHAHLIKSTSENNPSRRRLEKNLATTRERITSLIRTERESIRITLSNINKQGTSVYSRIQSVPQQERGLLEKARQQKVIENLFLYLMQKREETNVAMASATEKAKVVVSPSDGNKVYPSIKRTLAIFIFLGMVFPTAFIFLTDFFRTVVDDLAELRRLTGIKIIGEIGHDTSSIVVRKETSSHTAEQFRMMRNSIDYHFGHEDHKLLLITSPAHSEGKTFISINLALAFTLLGKRVLLADIDMRHDNLNKFLHSKSAKGLTDFLTGDILKWENAVEYMKSFPTLHILKAGAIPPNPNELLMSDRFRDFVGEARSAYDYVILDSPPAGHISDAFIIAEYADMTLYVVREKQTPKAMIADLENEKYAQLNNLRIVYNDIIAMQPAGHRAKK